MSLFTPNWLYWEHRVKISANECQWKELVVAHGEHTYYIYIKTCWCAHAYTRTTPRARASRAGGQLCGIMLYLYPTPLPQVYIYLLPNQPQFAIVCVCAIIFTSSCSHLLDYEFLCCVEQRLDPPRTSKCLCFCWSPAWHQRHLVWLPQTEESSRHWFVSVFHSLQGDFESMSSWLMLYYRWLCS